LLSRLQFTASTLFHFLFVPLTLGLSILVAIMETQYVRTGNETYLRMTKFWGKLFLINFAVGVVTGITLEFQFGTNWSRYSAYVGDVFGSLLAIEATAAFFLESTLVGVWVFGWQKLSRKAHATVMWPVAGASNLSAMESLWETTESAPIYLFALPDEKNEKNAIQIGAIPGLLSFLGHHDFNAEVTGLKDIPQDERPPVLLTFLSFRTMVALGTLFPLLTLIGIYLRNRLTENPWYLKIMLFSTPLPYLAIEMGWLLAELGRQPWIVYGLMKTSDGVSPIALSQVAVSLAAFLGVYGLLGAIGYFLIFKYAKKGPEPA